MPTYIFTVAETTVSAGKASIEAHNKHEAWELMQAKIDERDLEEVKWNYSDAIEPCWIEAVRDEQWNDIFMEGDDDQEGAEPTEHTAASEV